MWPSLVSICTSCSTKGTLSLANGERRTANRNSMFSSGRLQQAGAAGAAPPCTSQPSDPRPEETASSSVQELLFAEETEEEDLFSERLDDTTFLALEAAIESAPRSSTPPPPPPLWASSPGVSGEQLLSADSLVASPLPLGCRSAIDLLSPLSGLAISPMLHQSPGAGFPFGCTTRTGGAPALADTRLQASIPSSGERSTATSSYEAPQGSDSLLYAPPISEAQQTFDTAQSPNTSAITTTASSSTVCLLVVGGGGRAGGPAAALGGSNPPALGTTLGGLADVISMLTKELKGHGLTLEIEHVVSGERAVQQVNALARHGLWYKMILLEVEEQGSLAGAAATAWGLRAANATAPIVAIAPPQALLHRRSTQNSYGTSSRRQGPMPSTLKTEQQQHNSEVLERYLNEYLTVPVTGMEVSDLAQRWLLTPPAMGRMLTARDEGHRTDGASFAACRRAALLGASSNSSHSPLSQSVTTPAVSSSSSSSSKSERRNDSSPQQRAKKNAWWTMPGSASDGMDGQHTLTRPSSGDAQQHSIQMACSPAEVTVFGGESHDRASPCELFSSDSISPQNTETWHREFDFVFHHGTIVLRVEENDYGALIPVVCSACAYATKYFGDVIGKPLQAMFEGAATNKETAQTILSHIEDGDTTDGISSYMNLKSECGEHDMASFVSCRPLSRKPRRKCREQLPPWYVVLKVCLPSTIGLIKEPQLLDEMYSRSAMGTPAPSSTRRGRTAGGRASSKRKSKMPLIKRGAKKPKAS